MATNTMAKNICNLPVCRFSYRHFYDYKICGSQNGGNTRQPVSATSAEEPLSDWERRVLEGDDKDRVVHFFTPDPGVRCKIDLSDNKTHVVTGNPEGVTCKDCKIAALAEENKKFANQNKDLKEQLRVSEQAYTVQYREARNLRRRIEDERRINRRLLTELDRYRHGYVSPVSPYEPRYSADRYRY